MDTMLNQESESAMSYDISDNLGPIRRKSTKTVSLNNCAVVRHVPSRCLSHRVSVTPYADSVRTRKTKKLREAVALNNTELVESLLKDGANPNSVDEHLRTPLHLASCSGYVEVIRLLLQKGANPNNLDSMGNTPLHLAVCTNHFSVMKDLINAGTDITILNRHGKNPLHLAKSKLKLFQTRTFKDFDPENSKIISEISSIVSMMVKYMRIKKVDWSEVEAIAVRLQNIRTREQMKDEVSILLGNFDSLNLSSE